MSAPRRSLALMAGLIVTIAVSSLSATPASARVAAEPAPGLPAVAADSSSVAARPALARAGSDVTRTRVARSSKAHRKTVSVKAFVSSPHARRVVYRESKGQCRVVNPSGKYRGKWQMDRNFWRAYGGKAFASTPDRATCAEQDIVAWRGWVASWWHPWGG